MPSPELEADYESAKRNYTQAASRLAEVLEQIAVASVLDQHPTAKRIDVQGEYDEEGGLRLRLQRILDSDVDGSALWDIDEGGDEWVDVIDSEYLDWLADITGEDWVGEHQLDMEAGTR